ncbi:hypothetical protein SAMN05443661_1291, partial [Natronobacterium gregoryi]
PETAHNKRPDAEDEGWVLDDDICTDGGTVVGFSDASHPQPYDNSHRLWYVNDQTLERPLVKLDEPAVGCYTLTGESVLTFPADQSKETSVPYWRRSASRIRVPGFCSSWTTFRPTSVNTRASAHINSVSISSFFRSVPHIPIQSSRSGKCSNGMLHQSSWRARARSALSLAASSTPSPIDLDSPSLGSTSSSVHICKSYLDHYSGG